MHVGSRHEYFADPKMTEGVGCDRLSKAGPFSNGKEPLGETQAVSRSIQLTLFWVDGLREAGQYRSMWTNPAHGFSCPIRYSDDPLRRSRPLTLTGERSASAY